jgi:L-fucose isomerase-like protein
MPPSARLCPYRVGCNVKQQIGIQPFRAFICKNGFEHHVAMTMGSVADALDEALTTYMGWENYNHS